SAFGSEPRISNQSTGTPSPSDTPAAWAGSVGGGIRPTRLPAGSVNWANVTIGVSVTGTTVDPPSVPALSSVAWRSSTSTYTFTEGRPPSAFPSPPLIPPPAWVSTSV